MRRYLHIDVLAHIPAPVAKNKSAEDIGIEPEDHLEAFG